MLIQPPRTHAPGLTTARFNAVKSALELRQQDYQRLTRTQKGKATNVLHHNRYDVEALPILFEKIYHDDKSCLLRAVSKCLD